MSTHRHITAAALLACALSHAQGPTSWAARSFPSGVDAHAVEGQGKLVTYDAGSALHVFSSATRAWRSYAKSPTTNVRLFNDVALLIDPDRVVAVSSYFAEPAKRTLSAPYSLWNSPGAKNDSIVLIREGTLLHAFSAFSGRWVTRAIDPGASGAVQRHVAVVASGNQLFGMSAFDGSWRDTDASAPTSLSSDGTAAFAFGATIHAFSAHTRRWSHATTPPNASFTRGDDWGIWLGPSGGLAYSGLTGSLAAIALPDAAVAVSSDLYALFGDSAELYAYSAVTGDVLAVGAAPSSVDAGLGAALLHAPNGVRGYSPMRQQTQPLAATPVSSNAGAACAHIVDAGGAVHAFSAFTGAWHTAPAGTAGQVPLATTTTLALTSPLDCYAFSPKTGHYEALGAPVDGLAGNVSSAPLLAYDAGELHAFDSEHARWISTPRTGSGTPTFRIWRTTAVVIDGASAHSFGAQAGAWHRYDLGASVSATFANSEVGYLVDGQRIVACSVLPEIAALQQFPHFRRVQPRAAEVAFMAATPGDALVLGAVSLGGATTTLPTLGVLHLDLSSATTFLVSAPATPPVEQLRWTPPASAALAGATVFAQLLVAPANGAPPYLSDRATVQLW